MERLKLESAALAYAEREWEVIVSKVTSTMARGFMVGMKDQVIDVLRRTYLAGAREASAKE